MTSAKNSAFYAKQTVRNSHRRLSVKEGVLKNFANFRGKHLCGSLFLIKVQVFSPILKKIYERQLLAS